MRIVLVTHHRLPVRGYGGTQRVIVWLARALTALGHEVRIVAGRGSRLPEFECATAASRQFRRLYAEPEYDASEMLPGDADVYHFPKHVSARIPRPYLFTVHGNGEPGSDDPRAVFVSRNHMERMGGRRFVHNGVDPEEYRYRAQKSDDFLFLAKASWRVKGVKVAERIARRADVRLVVAGGWRPRLRRAIRWVGTVDGDRKAQLLADARALIFPIQWEEPFGLVVVEAWMSGTPVLAAPRGAMPELVGPGVERGVGRLCASEDEFVDAVRDVEKGTVRYDPAACRAYALERFGHLRMARDYVALYERAIAERWEAA